MPSAIQQRGLLRLLVEEDTDFEAISPPPVRTVEFCPQSCLQSSCSSFRRLQDSSACDAITFTAGYVDDPKAQRVAILNPHVRLLWSSFSSIDSSLPLVSVTG